MSTVYDVLQDALLESWREYDVSVSAGVTSASWASSSVPHVFPGWGESIGGRNLGRLPFVEVEIAGTDWDGNWNDGGTVIAQVSIAVHVSGSDWARAHSSAYSIATAGLTATKCNHLLRVGEVVIAPLTAGPWGHILPVQMTVELTYNESDFSNV